MNVKNIKEFCDTKPFRPFSVYLSDGRSIPVEHPELVFFPPNNQEVLIYQRDSSFDIVDAFQITSLNRKRNPAKSTKKDS